MFRFLDLVRYLEPVIAVLSRIWAEIDSMREHRLLRFKLLRQGCQLGKPQQEKDVELNISGKSTYDILIIKKKKNNIIHTRALFRTPFYRRAL